MPSRLHTRLLDPRGVALGRTGVGLSMLARPRLMPSLMGADAETSAGVEWIVQMLGAREVVLGLGTLAGRKNPRSWLAAGAFCDAVDAVAVSAALGRGRVAKAPGAVLVGVAVLAVASQVGGLRRP